MPTYEYRCPDGHEFELVQRMSDEPKATCPECGAEASRLLSAGAGFLFKGDGFYITDYRSAEYRKAAGADSKGTSGEKTKDGGAPSSSGSGEGAKRTDGSVKGGTSPGSPGGSSSGGGTKGGDTGAAPGKKGGSAPGSS